MPMHNIQSETWYWSAFVDAPRVQFTKAKYPHVENANSQLRCQQICTDAHAHFIWCVKRLKVVVCIGRAARTLRCKFSVFSAIELHSGKTKWARKHLSRLDTEHKCVFSALLFSLPFFFFRRFISAHERSFDDKATIFGVLIRKNFSYMAAKSINMRLNLLGKTPDHKKEHLHCALVLRIEYRDRCAA